jgi:hypothetical protein
VCKSIFIFLKKNFITGIYLRLKYIGAYVPSPVTSGSRSLGTQTEGSPHYSGTLETELDILARVSSVTAGE